MELEKEAKKEIERTEKIMETLEITDPKSGSLVRVMKSYYEDSKLFYKKKQYLQALEAAFIVWAYADAGLHLGAFRVPESLRKMFTV